MENNSYYLALVEPTSSQPLQVNFQPNDDQEKFDKVDMDTKYPDVSENNMKSAFDPSSDIAKTLATIKFDSETVNHLSVDRRDITDLLDIVTKFSSSEPQIQEGEQLQPPGYSYGKYSYKYKL